MVVAKNRSAQITQRYWPIRSRVAVASIVFSFCIFSREPRCLARAIARACLPVLCNELLMLGRREDSAKVAGQTRSIVDVVESVVSRFDSVDEFWVLCQCAREYRC